MAGAKERQRHSTAIHEAAHAVVSMSLGRTIRYASVVKQGEMLGHVRYPRPRRYSEGSMSVQVALDHMESSLAGYLAELEFAYRPATASWQAKREATFDYADAISASSEEAQKWLHLAELRARQRVGIWRPAILAVAEKLIVQGRLSGSDLRAAMIEAVQ